MNTHSIDLIRYRAQSRGNSTIYLGTAGSHGNEQLQVTQGKGWEGLTVQVVFHPCKVAVQLPANGLLDVPWEATAQPLSMMQGRIVFQGFDQDRLVNSTDLAYSVASHSPTLGRDEQPYTPGIVEGVLNQMAADKDAILQAAQQTGQAKEAAAASAAAAASSAANAQQSAGAANTSAGQAAASASQAAGSAAAANETLTQVQTAGQEAQQKVKDAETEALGNIAAAAPALPAVSSAAAWQSVTVKPDGTGYNLAAMAPIEATIRPTVTGNPAVCEDSAAWAFQGLKIYGKSTQDGTPSPENPVPIVSAGDGGKVDTFFCTQNLFLVKSALGGLETDAYSIECSDDTNFTVRAKRQTIGNSVFIRVPINIPVGKTVSISGKSTGANMFKLQNRNPDGAVASGESSYNTNTRKPGLSIFAVCNPFGPGEVIVQEGQTVTFSEIMVNYGDSALPWEPYKSQTLALSTPNGLPGIPVESGGTFTDADGQQLVCDVKDYGAGKYTQNCVKVVFDGSDDENWLVSETTSPGLYRYYTNNINPPPIAIAETAAYPDILCNLFAPVPSGNLGTYGAKQGVSVTPSGSLAFYSNAINGQDKTEWINWIKENPLTVVYQPATPIETDIPAEELAAYRVLQTYAGTTVVSTAEPVAGIEARYVMNGNKYRESVDKRLAALEAAQTGI